MARIFSRKCLTLALLFILNNPAQALTNRELGKLETVNDVYQNIPVIDENIDRFPIHHPKMEAFGKRHPVIGKVGHCIRKTSNGVIGAAKYAAPVIGAGLAAVTIILLCI